MESNTNKGLRKEDGTSLAWGRGGTSGKGELLRKGGRRVNTVQKCVHLYVNEKMIPAETTPGIWGEREMKEKGRGGEFIYVIHCKNLCKCHNIPPPITMIKGKKEKEKEKCLTKAHFKLA
jgi:hypothetical protein